MLALQQGNGEYVLEIIVLERGTTIRVVAGLLPLRLLVIEPAIKARAVRDFPKPMSCNGSSVSLGPQSPHWQPS